LRDSQAATPPGPLAFADRMGSPGYLCVAAAESLLRLSTPFELKTCGGAFVYVKS
jgi:hypothetical protein